MRSWISLMRAVMLLMFVQHGAYPFVGALLEVEARCRQFIHDALLGPLNQQRVGLLVAVADS